MNKRALYKAGNYWCEVPPVCTANWSDSDWIKWITNHGGWGCLDK